MSQDTVLERIHPVDHAWLRMDTDRNPMVMVGVIEFRTNRSTRSFSRILVERLLHHPRFSQFIDNSLSPPAWRPVETLDWAYHVHSFPHAKVSNRASLQERIHRELDLGLDHARPLWRLSLFRKRGGRLIALFRAHHAIADGVAMLRLLRELDDRSEEVAPAIDSRFVEVFRNGPLAGLIHRLESLNSILLGAGQLVGSEARHPGQIPGQVESGEEVAAAVLKLLRLPVDHPSAFTGTLCGRRRIAWSRPIPLRPLHETAHRAGVTINDIFLAALAAVFRMELRDRGHVVERKDCLRITLPVNLRTDHDGSTGNHFGLVLLDLPIGETQWAVRLEEISNKMHSLKESAEARAVLLSLGFAGQLPAGLEHRLIDLLADKSVAVVSNLPGTSHPLQIANAEVENLAFFPPQAGHIGIGISLISHGGSLTVGASTDENRIADPSQFVRRMRQALAAAEGVA